MLKLKTNLYANNANNSQNNRKPSNKYGYKSSRLYRAIHRNNKKNSNSVCIYSCVTLDQMKFNVNFIFFFLNNLHAAQHIPI